MLSSNSMSRPVIEGERVLDRNDTNKDERNPRQDRIEIERNTIIKRILGYLIVFLFVLQ